MQHQANRKGKKPTPKREPSIFPMPSPSPPHPHPLQVVFNSFSFLVAVGCCVPLLGTIQKLDRFFFQGKPNLSCTSVRMSIIEMPLLLTLKYRFNL